MSERCNDAHDQRGQCQALLVTSRLTAFVTFGRITAIYGKTCIKEVHLRPEGWNQSGVTGHDVITESSGAPLAFCFVLVGWSRLCWVWSLPLRLYCEGAEPYMGFRCFQVT